MVLEDERGNPHEVSGEELGLLLQDERALRLAVLNSCEGARSSHLDPFSGAAASLLQQGAPAVIGMQFEITDDAAITFASRLYTSLARNLPVDAALAQARRSIFAAGNGIEFGTPVLFLQGRDARLFDVSPEGPDTGMPAAELEPQLEPPPYTEPPEPEPAPAVAPAEDHVYAKWLPRPWQESWLAFRADVLRGLGRIPNRPLAFTGALFILASIVITTAFGHENADGERQSTLGAVLLIIGLCLLLAMGAKYAYAKISAGIERLRNWWTGG